MLIALHSLEDVLRGNGPQYHSYTVNFISSTHLVKFRPICELCSDASGWKTSTLLLDSIWCDKLSHSWYELATNVILQSSPKKSWCIQSSKLIAQFFWLYPHGSLNLLCNCPNKNCPTIHLWTVSTGIDGLLKIEGKLQPHILVRKGKENPEDDKEMRERQDARNQTCTHIITVMMWVWL
jgi:hypothetical protein